MLALSEPPLNEVIRELLAIFANEMHAPVEIEFAMTSIRTASRSCRCGR
jgi:hypothetical protein